MAAEAPTLSQETFATLWREVARIRDEVLTPHVTEVEQLKQSLTGVPEASRETRLYVESKLVEADAAVKLSLTALQDELEKAANGTRVAQEISLAIKGHGGISGYPGGGSSSGSQGSYQAHSGKVAW